MSEQLNYNININSNASESLGSLKKQLREAQQEVAALSDKFGATSQQATEAAKRAAGLKDRIGDAKALTDAFNPDAKFQALSKTISIATGGFSAFQGAIGLVAGESKELEKTLLKVQSALAISQGVSQIGELGDAFNNLKSVAVNAFKSIRAAIGSTGIGLFVIALGTIAVYWDDIKAAVSGVSEEQKKLNKLAKDNFKTQQDKLDQIDAQTNQLRLQGKSETEILKIKIKQTDEAIAAGEAQLASQEGLRESQIEAARRNRDILQGIIRFTSAPLSLLLATIDEIGKAVGKDFGLEETYSGLYANLLFDPATVEKETDEAIATQKKALNALKENRAGYQLQINNIGKEAAAQSAKDAAEAEQQRIEREQAQIQRETAAFELNLKAYRATLDKRNQDLLAAEDEFENRKGDLIRAGIYDFTLLEEEFRLKKIEINKTYDKLEEEEAKKIEEKKKALEETNKQREFETRQLQAETLAEQKRLELEALENEYQVKYDLAVKNGEDLVALKNLYTEKEKDIEKKFTKQVIDEEKAKKQAKIQALNDTAAIIGSLANLAGEQTRVGKALTLAQIGVDTASAISSLTRNSEGNPANAVTFGAAGAIQFATGLIRILANIKKAKDLLSSSGSVSAPTLSSTSVAAPIVPAQPQAQLTQLDQNTINAIGNQAIRAYVVETDVTSNQKRVQAIKQRARFS